jgi:hypothetical protein
MQWWNKRTRVDGDSHEIYFARSMSPGISYACVVQISEVGAQANAWRALLSFYDMRSVSWAWEGSSPSISEETWHIGAIKRIRVLPGESQ